MKGLKINMQLLSHILKIHNNTIKMQPESGRQTPTAALKLNNKINQMILSIQR
jgi:hypothetical protein